MSTAPNPGGEPERDPDHQAVDDARMTFLEHLSDLRRRLRNSALIFLLATVTLIQMMLTIGLGVPISAALAVARDWWLVLRAAVANYALVPAIALGLLLRRVRK